MAAGRIGKLTVEIGAVFRGLDDALKGIERRLGRTASRLKSFGSAWTSAVSVPLGLATGAAAKFAGTFDQAMTRSVAIMGESGRAMRGELEAVAREMATKSTFAASELAASYYYLASAGFSAEQSIAALPAVVEFATAGAFDLQRATDLLTDAQTALGLSSKDAGENLANMTKLSDALVKANTLANASTEQFSEALTNKAAVAMRLVGMELEEGLAVLGAYANAGIKGADAGTQMSIALREVSRSAYNTRESFREWYDAVYDANNQMRPFAEIIRYLQERLEPLDDVQRRAWIEMSKMTEKSISAVLALRGQADAIEEYEEKLRAAGGTTREVADYQLRNFIDQMKILWNQIKDVVITVGQELNPVLLTFAREIAAKLVAMLNSLTERLKGMSSETKESIVQWGALVVAIGPVTMALGQVFEIASKLVGALPRLWKTIAENPFESAGAAAFYLAGGLGAIMTFLDPVKVDIIEKHNEAMRRWQEGVREGQARWQSLADQGRALTDVHGEVTRALETQESTWRVNLNLMPLVSAAWNKVSGAVSEVEKKLAELPRYVDPAREVFIEFAKQVGDTSVNVARSAVSLIDSTIGSISRGFGDAIAQALVYGESFSEAMKKMWLQVAASAISALVSMGIELVAYWLLSKTVLKGLATGNISTQAGRSYAGASASVWETMPWFVAIALAPIVAAGAAAQTLAGLAYAAFAEGGLVMGPTFGLLGEAGPELVLPLDRIAGLGVAQQTIIIEVDRRVLGRIAVEEMPEYVRARLGNLI